MFDEQRDDLRQLTRLTFELVESTSGKTVREDFLSFSTLMKKAFYHGLSVFQLSAGVVLGSNVQLLDVASIQVLVRAGLEVFLTFEMLHRASQDADEYEFRYCAWQYCGFNKRQGFPAPDAATKHQKVAEASVLAEYLRRAEATRFFSTLRKGQKEKVRKGWDWHPECSLTSLAGPVFGPVWGPVVYPFLSDYTHSGAMSILQMEELNTREDQRAAVELAMLLMSKLLSMMNERYAALFPEAGTALASHPGHELNCGYAALTPIDPTSA